MAVTQSTDTRIKIQPEITGIEYQLGPTNSVPFDAVQLTSENLRQIGARVPIVGEDWVCTLFVYDVISTVETARSLTGYTVAGTYWDPVSRSATALTVALGAGTGEVTITFADTDSLTAGTYEFSIVATKTDTFTLCSGWIEILPSTPATS